MGRSGELIASNDPFVVQLLANPNYDVRTDGSVWTRLDVNGKVSSKPDFWRRCDQSKKTDHKFVSYTSDGRHIKLLAHRIIYAKFNGSLETDLMVYHHDGNKLNNEPSNLKLGPQKENNLHNFRVLKRLPVMGNKKLDEKEIAAIRMLWGMHYSLRRIGAQFGISKGHVSMIVNNKIWVTKA